MIKEKLVLRKEIKKIIRKALYTAIIFLVGMILIKQNPSYKDKINKIIYKDNPNYIKLKKTYDKFFSGKIEVTKSVFTEQIEYQNKEDIKDGVELTVSNNYLVPILESGIIIYLENNKVIISQVNGINVEYNNVKVNNYKLYDYIEKGKPLGETIENKLILKFEKEGEYLDYKKYL